MDNVRCLIADIPHNLLADIVQRITESRSDIEVVGRFESKDGLPQIVRDSEADVVIFGMEAGTLSNECKEMFDAKPELVIVGLVEDGRRAAIIIDDVGPKEIMDIMHVAFKDKLSRR